MANTAKHQCKIMYPFLASKPQQLPSPRNRKKDRKSEFTQLQCRRSVCRFNETPRMKSRGKGNAPPKSPKQAAAQAAIKCNASSAVCWKSKKIKQPVMHSFWYCYSVIIIVSSVVEPSILQRLRWGFEGHEGSYKIFNHAHPKCQDHEKIERYPLRFN